MESSKACVWVLFFFLHFFFHAIFFYVCIDLDYAWYSTRFLRKTPPTFPPSPPLQVWGVGGEQGLREALDEREEHRKIVAQQINKARQVQLSTNHHQLV